MFLKLFENRAPQETTYINEIFYDLFNEVDDILEKKYIAEILINYRNPHIDVFIWYLKYLQNPDSTITEMVVDFNNIPNFYCDKLSCIYQLERLWLIASLKKSEKTRIMKDIVSNSYIKIAGKIKTKFQYSILMISIKRLIRKTHSIEMEDVQQKCTLEFADSYSHKFLI